MSKTIDYKYQMKIKVDMLTATTNNFADVLSVNPLSGLISTSIKITLNILV